MPLLSRLKTFHTNNVLICVNTINTSYQGTIAEVDTDHIVLQHSGDRRWVIVPLSSISEITVSADR